MTEEAYLAISETIQHSNQESLKSCTWHINININEDQYKHKKCTPLYGEPEMSWEWDWRSS